MTFWLIVYVVALMLTWTIRLNKDTARNYRWQQMTNNAATIVLSVLTIILIDSVEWEKPPGKFTEAVLWTGVAAFLAVGVYDLHNLLVDRKIEKLTGDLKGESNDDSIHPSV